MLDRSPKFTSALWNSMAVSLGFLLYHTSAYQPQSNGVVECLHPGLKASLWAHLCSPSWMEQLPWVLPGLRASVHSDFSCSSSGLVFRHSPLLPGELFQHSHMQLPATTPSAHHNSPSHSSSCSQLDAASHIYVRMDAHWNVLQPPYKGPYLVLCHYPKPFKLSVFGSPQWISIDHLEATFLENSPDTQIPAATTRPGHTVRPPDFFQGGGGLKLWCPLWSLSACFVYSCLYLLFAFCDPAWPKSMPILTCLFYVSCLHQMSLYKTR